MENIKNWLASEQKDYSEGLALLATYGRNRNLAVALSRKESSANFEKLVYELEKLSKQDIVLVVAGNAGLGTMVAAMANQSGKTVLIATPANTHGEELNVHLVPETTQTDFDALVVEMSKLYNERCQLSNTLADIHSEEESAKVVANILDLQERYNAMAEKKAYFEEHGKFPEETTEEAKTPAEEVSTAQLKQDLLNLRSRVTKAKKAADKNPDDVKKQETYAKLLVEKNALEAKLQLLK